MAVNSTKVSSELKVTMVVGVDSKGNDKLANKTIGSIKLEASDDNVFAVANAIANVKAYPIVSVHKEDSFVLANE